MISLLFYFLLLALIIGFAIVSIIMLILSIIIWKKKRQRIVLVILSALYLFLGICIYSIDLTSAETENRDESVEAFEQNFGFSPPSSIQEIKHKNVYIYDASAHWMSFTYDSLVFLKILDHDKPLENAIQSTSEFHEIASSIEQGCANCPKWLELPDEYTTNIYHKKGFLKHTNSEYYLWVNRKTNMVYLEVTYFD